MCACVCVRARARVPVRVCARACTCVCVCCINPRRLQPAPRKNGPAYFYNSSFFSSTTKTPNTDSFLSREPFQPSQRSQEGRVFSFSTATIKIKQDATCLVAQNIFQKRRELGIFFVSLKNKTQSFFHWVLFFRIRSIRIPQHEANRPVCVVFWK